MTPTSNPESTQTPNPESPNLQIQKQNNEYYYYKMKIEYDKQLQIHGWLKIPEDKEFFIRSDIVSYIYNLSNGMIYFVEFYGNTEIYTKYQFCEIGDKVKKLLNHIFIQKMIENPNLKQYIITADDVKAYQKEVLEKIKECEEKQKKIKLRDDTFSVFEDLKNKLMTHEARVEFRNYYDQLIETASSREDVIKKLNEKFNDILINDMKIYTEYLKNENKKLRERLYELEKQILESQKEEEKKDEEDE